MHWQGAGEHDKAAALRDAGGRARVQGARLRSRGAALSADAGDAAARRRRRGRRCRCGSATRWRRRGRGAEAARAYLSAAERVDAPADALELRRKAAEQLLRAGHVDDGLQAMAPVLAAVKLRVPESPRAAADVALVAARAAQAARPQVQAARRRPSCRRRCWRASTRRGRSRSGSATSTPSAAPTSPRATCGWRCEAGEPSRVARAMAFEACLTAAHGRRRRGARQRARRRGGEDRRRGQRRARDRAGGGGARHRAAHERPLARLPALLRRGRAHLPRALHRRGLGAGDGEPAFAATAWRASAS